MLLDFGAGLAAGFLLTAALLLFELLLAGFLLTEPLLLFELLLAGFLLTEPLLLLLEPRLAGFFVAVPEDCLLSVDFFTLPEFELGFVVVVDL
ncbi:MAG: hypothetical protein ABIJ61_07075 [bacterium]